MLLFPLLWLSQCSCMCLHTRLFLSVKCSRRGCLMAPLFDGYLHVYPTNWVWHFLSLHVIRYNVCSDKLL